MEVKLDPKLIDAIARAKARPDWRAIARRVESLDGGWCMVWQTDGVKPATEWVREHLRMVGCRAEVRSLQGLAIAQRPWTGWVTYARVLDREQNLAIFTMDHRLVRAPNL